MDFSSVLNNIIEVYGVVGLIVVCLLIIIIIAIPVALPFLLDKQSKKIERGLTTGLDNFANKLTDNLTNQNNLLISSLIGNQEKMISLLVDRPIEEKKIHDEGMDHRDNMTEIINNKLLNMLNAYGCSRIGIIEFHNGGYNLGGIPFKSYNIVYQQVDKGVDCIEVVDSPYATIHPIVKMLKDNIINNFVFLDENEIKKLEKINTVLYSYLYLTLKLKAVCYAGIWDQSNHLVGMVFAEYQQSPDRQFIKNCKEKILANVAYISSLYNVLKDTEDL